MINEQSIANSFRAVKGDIFKIEGELINMKEQQIHILEKLEKLTLKLKPSIKRVIKKKK
jgi:protein-arginine kinase activator protein McsA